MDITAYREEIRLKLTGGVLDMEINDETLDKIINSSLREIQRYICSTELITVPYSKCIDLSQYKINAIANVYRTEAFGLNGGQINSTTDPMYAQQWQLFSGGNLNNFSNYALNYAAWSTLQQVRNTLSTDMFWKYDERKKQLYVNASQGTPANVTIEYVPRFDSVEEVVSDFWIDNLINMAVATTKITLGRIRSRYTQTNALWAQDGERLLEEGNAELTALREYLRANTQLTYPVD